MPDIGRGERWVGGDSESVDEGFYSVHWTIDSVYQSAREPMSRVLGGSKRGTVEVKIL
jgi:hypothetical protein